jgi:1-acyl-sn-glycerol-3-phosphate acyltransferase
MSEQGPKRSLLGLDPQIYDYNFFFTVYVSIKTAWATFRRCFYILYLLKFHKKRAGRAPMDRIIKEWARELLQFISVNPIVSNPNGIDLSGKTKFILMSNHASHYDIPIIFDSIPGSTRMVAKSELSLIPFFGKTLKALDFIFIERKNKAKAIKDLQLAKEKLEGGILIWIAPEGTRSKTGKLGMLKKGGFKLSLETNVPILPVKIVGSYHILAPHRFFTLKSHVPVSVVIGNPVYPQALVSHDNIKELIQSVSQQL